jgi:hypothetical protein
MANTLDVNANSHLAAEQLPHPGTRRTLRNTAATVTPDDNHRSSAAFSGRTPALPANVSFLPPGENSTGNPFPDPAFAGYSPVHWERSQIFGAGVTQSFEGETACEAGQWQPERSPRWP